jgi:hypothetical protein
MKTSRHSVLTFVAALGLAAGSATATAQGFNTGSDGSLGDVVIGASTNIALPPDGLLHYRSLQVASGVTVTFTRNARNTPVYILSQSDVVISANATIDVSGSTANPPPNSGGVGGPGGFDGGQPGFGPETPAGNGYGPGGGRAGSDANCEQNDAAGGAYGSIGFFNAGVYGSRLLIPLVGGSGGGGSIGNTRGGGGGGGAILIAAAGEIRIDGQVAANGGRGGTCNNRGSGGAIRLVAFKVGGGGSLNALGGTSNGRSFGSEGQGRIRIDSIDRTNIRFGVLNGDFSTGGNLLVFPPTIPTLTLTEVAGLAIPEGSTNNTFFLPFGSTTNRTVKLRARDFGRVITNRVTLTPDSGPARTFDTVIDNTVANPAEGSVDVVVPVNTKVMVHAWTL